jgi:hypothetical protein
MPIRVSALHDSNPWLWSSPTTVADASVATTELCAMGRGTRATSAVGSRRSMRGSGTRRPRVAGETSIAARTSSSAATASSRCCSRASSSAGAAASCTFTRSWRTRRRRSGMPRRSTSSTWPSLRRSSPSASWSAVSVRALAEPQPRTFVVLRHGQEAQGIDSRVGTFARHATIIHVSTALTQRTGITMRELRFRRFVCLVASSFAAAGLYDDARAIALAKMQDPNARAVEVLRARRALPHSPP